MRGMGRNKTIYVILSRTCILIKALFVLKKEKKKKKYLWQLIAADSDLSCILSDTYILQQKCIGMFFLIPFSMLFAIVY